MPQSHKLRPLFPHDSAYRLLTWRNRALSIHLFLPATYSPKSPCWDRIHKSSLTDQRPFVDILPPRRLIEQSHSVCKLFVTRPSALEPECAQCSQLTSQAFTPTDRSIVGHLSHKSQHSPARSTLCRPPVLRTLFKLSNHITDYSTTSRAAHHILLRHGQQLVLFKKEKKKRKRNP